MIAGLGLDLVDVSAFRELVRVPPGRSLSPFAAATFTPAELRYCTQEALGDPVLHLAARFAAKEATLKALDSAAAALGLSPPNVPVADVEVVRDARGRPSLRLVGGAWGLWEALELSRSHISLTHEGTTAGAIVVVERLAPLGSGWGT